MNYVITWVKNVDEFIAELETMAPSYITTDEDGKKSCTIQTTPIVKSANGTLAMSILTDDELAFIATMTTMKSLGTYEELFSNPDSLALYKSVYPYDIPLSYVDEEGNTVEYMRPFKIGEFAR